MLTFFLVLHFVIAVFLVFIIVIQKGEEGGALGIGGGSDGVFSPRGQANLLTKATSILAGLFMINCIVIANLVTSSSKQKSLVSEIVENE